MTSFTTNWVTSHEAVWKEVLEKFAGKPNIRAMEIGVFEGRSASWFLAEVLTHPTSTIICIDPVPRPVFRQNVSAYASRITLLEETAQTALRDTAFPVRSFHFIYLDGDHKARAVLENAVLCFRLLKTGGVLIIDDYLWKSPHGDDELLTPKIAVDYFLKIYKGQYRILHRGRQIIIERVLNGRL